MTVRDGTIAATIVETMGLEPTTFWMQTRCSSQLSYVPVGQGEDSVAFPVSSLG
jgi:hypothetical protein